MIKEKWLRIIFILVVVFLLVQSTHKRFVVKNYEMYSDKIDSDIKIAFISDLHSCYYGENQKELLDSIDEQKPDIILLGGDIVDDRVPYNNAMIVLEALSKKYPCYYVSGNHEIMSEDMDGIKERIRKYSIEVLEGSNAQVTVRGQIINICGIDDPMIGNRKYETQLDTSLEGCDTQNLTLLLAHRPEYINEYLRYDFNLIFSGHAHGGQWRIPGILNGLYAPNQGFFPKYAGGKYEYATATHIVGRGLARESTRIPRLFNPPELVIVDVRAKQ